VHPTQIDPNGPALLILPMVSLRSFSTWCFVIGNEDGEAGVAQIGDDLLDIVHGDGIDAAEGLVQHEHAGLGGQERAR